MQDNKTKNTGTNPKGDRMRKAGATLIAVAMVFGAGEASAQAYAYGNASININEVIWMDVTNLTVQFPAVESANYDADGTGEIGANTSSVISTRANVAHSVLIAADAPAMTGPDGSSKNADDLRWGTTGAEGAFSGLTTDDEPVVSGLSRGVSNSAAEVWYRMALDLATDEPGMYTLAFTYTAIAD